MLGAGWQIYLATRKKNDQLWNTYFMRPIAGKRFEAHVQAGAGIVADSVPEREFEETQNKARALLRAIEAAEQAG